MRSRVGFVVFFLTTAVVAAAILYEALSMSGML